MPTKTPETQITDERIAEIRSMRAIYPSQNDSEIVAIIDRLRQAEFDRDVAMRAFHLTVLWADLLSYEGDALLDKARQQIVAERNTQNAK